MNHLKTYEIFLTRFFSKKKEKSNRGEEGYPYSVITFKYLNGDIVKRITDGIVGKIIDKGVDKYYVSGEFTPYYVVDFGETEVKKYNENEITIPTEEEIEFYKTTKNYNL